MRARPSNFTKIAIVPRQNLIFQRTNVLRSPPYRTRGDNAHALKNQIVSKISYNATLATLPA
jgi:hypothetical protein